MLFLPHLLISLLASLGLNRISIPSFDDLISPLDLLSSLERLTTWVASSVAENHTSPQPTILAPPADPIVHVLRVARRPPIEMSVSDPEPFAWTDPVVRPASSLGDLAYYLTELITFVPSTSKVFGRQPGPSNSSRRSWLQMTTVRPQCSASVSHTFERAEHLAPSDLLRPIAGSTAEEAFCPDLADYPEFLDEPPQGISVLVLVFLGFVGGTALLTISSVMRRTRYLPSHAAIIPGSTLEFVPKPSLLGVLSQTNSPAVDSRSGLDFLGFPSLRVKVDLPPAACKDARPDGVAGTSGAGSSIGLGLVKSSSCATLDPGIVTPACGGVPTQPQLSCSVPHVSVVKNLSASSNAANDAIVQASSSNSSSDYLYKMLGIDTDVSDCDLAATDTFSTLPLSAGAASAGNIDTQASLKVVACVGADQEDVGGEALNVEDGYPRARRGCRGGRNGKSVLEQRRLALELESIRAEAEKLKALLASSTISDSDTDEPSQQRSTSCSSGSESSCTDLSSGLESSSSGAVTRRGRRTRRGAEWNMDNWNVHTPERSRTNTCSDALRAKHAEVSPSPMPRRLAPLKLSQASLQSIRGAVESSSNGLRSRSAGRA